MCTLYSKKVLQSSYLLMLQSGYSNISAMSGLFATSMYENASPVVFQWWLDWTSFISHIQLLNTKGKTLPYFLNFITASKVTHLDGLCKIGIKVLWKLLCCFKWSNLCAFFVFSIRFQSQKLKQHNLIKILNFCISYRKKWTTCKRHTMSNNVADLSQTCATYCI